MALRQPSPGLCDTRFSRVDYRDVAEATLALVVGPRGQVAHHVVPMLERLRGRRIGCCRVPSS